MRAVQRKLQARGRSATRLLTWLLVLLLTAAGPAGAWAANVKGAVNRVGRRPAPPAATRKTVPVEGVVARAVSLQGPFFVRMRGWSRWQTFKGVTSLRSGEELRVLDSSRVELQIPARAVLRTRGESFLLVRASELLMDAGTADVRALDQERLVLVTPDAELSARGARFSVEVLDGAPTRLRVLSGVVAGRDREHGRERLAGTGMEMLFEPGRAPLVRRFSASLRQELERFSDTGPTPSSLDGPESAPPAEPETAAAKVLPAPGAKGPDRTRNSKAAAPSTPARPAGAARRAGDAVGPPKRSAVEPALSLRDRMHGLRSPEERMRRWELALAQQAAADKEEFDRQFSASKSRKTLLQEDSQHKKAWMLNRREQTLIRGEMLDRAHRRVALYADDSTRDDLLEARRRQALGRSLWFQTRQGLLETRQELTRTEQTLANLATQLSALGTPPTDATLARALTAQRDSLLERVNRIKDRIEELIEIP
ncbi:MAG: hypothetical protein HY814_12910 [Candidatus Riflebacteria bacterium]|nr:hypothetical protein [Candidatus Riflebacteria bacterium]